MRSPTLLLIRMKAAETRASRAIADWTPLTVVSRSVTTAEIDTFISEVSTTSTNMAVARSTAKRWSPDLLDPSATAPASSFISSPIIESPGLPAPAPLRCTETGR